MDNRLSGPTSPRGRVGGNPAVRVGWVLVVVLLVGEWRFRPGGGVVPCLLGLCPVASGSARLSRRRAVP